MAEETAVISGQRIALHPSEARFSRQSFNPMSIRKPEYNVYIFNTNEREFILHRPPLFPTLRIIGCPAGKSYVLAKTISHPVQQGEPGIDTNEIRVFVEDARSVAADICNPDNPYGPQSNIPPMLHQDTVVPPERVMSSGENLSAQGVFWSLNNPPTDEEVAAAAARREKYYRSLLENARILEMGNPTMLSQILNADYHMAADHFGLETTWHRRKAIQTTSCPNCGEEVKPGVAYHKNSLGVLCVLDWKRAVAAGAKTRQEAVDAGATL